MLDIQRLSVKRASATVLEDLTLSLPKGSITALIGKNGSGKSTLLSAIGGTCEASGEMLLDGFSIPSLSPRERARHVSLLPQLLAAPHMTVRELVLLGRHPHRTAFSRLGGEDAIAVAGAIRDADISHLADRYLDEISGGELQRAYLGMILSQDAPLWLLDEPTSHMDLSVAARFMGLLVKLTREKGNTILVAIHDLNSALRYADHIALLDDGHIAFFGTTEECLATDAIERTFSVRRIGTSEEPFFIG